jgi:hypothetical protein
LENYLDIKFRLFYEHKVDQNWIENIPYYEYQIFLDNLNKKIEAENVEAQSADGLKQIFSFSK